jgi:hypothetical protein
LATHSNTFAFTAACAPSNDPEIRYNVCTAISMTLRFPPLNKNKNLAQDNLIETRRKRDNKHPLAAHVVVSWRTSSPSM